MGILSEATEIPRKTMIMFFLVDTSGSMDGEKIGSLNDAMREVIPDLKDISDSNADALIKIAILDFASGTQWITPVPQNFETFKWQDLDAGGCTDLGEACLELNSKLNREQFLQDKVGNYAPVIILLSDGSPTDNYQKGLGALRANKWFGAAIKIAFSIGSDADTDYLAQFTDNPELVIPIMNKSMMKKMIRFVSVTSSKIGSKKAGDEEHDGSKQAELIQEIKYEMQELDPEDEIDEGW